MLQPVVRRTWAPRGCTPVQKSWDRRDRLSVECALTVSPRRRCLGLYFQIHSHNIRFGETIKLLTLVNRILHQNSRSTKPFFNRIYCYVVIGFGMV